MIRPANKSKGVHQFLEIIQRQLIPNLLKKL